MKAKKIIALLLCLATVAGILPMSLSAEDAATVAETAGVVEFNETFDFNATTTSTDANEVTLAAMLNDKDTFSISIHNGSANMSYVKRDENGDMALRLTNSHGFKIDDHNMVLLKIPFVLEYDVRFEKIGGNSNTVQLVGCINNVETDGDKTGFMPTKPSATINGVAQNATYAITQNLSSFSYPTAGYSVDIPIDNSV